MPKTLCALLCLLFLGGALLAQPQPSAYLIESSSHLEWQIQDEFEGVSVVVVGPEGFSPLTRHFQRGESPFVALQGDRTSLPDGQYTWEIRIQPLQTELRARHQDVASRGLGAERRLGALKGSTEAGTFRVRNGLIVSRFADEPQTAPSPATATDSSGLQTKASAAQLIADDLIVEGSTCTGFDCNISESFGFDTLRLKENNLRIHFDDTSASASFPGNDWRLVANDSGNGGANKFSIEDATGGRTPFTIEAGAPNDSLRVDDGGNLGLGTAAPVVEAHMVDGDTPTLRLEQDGSSGFTPQTWDVAGNDANFFVRDATNGSTLPFRIFPSAPTNALTVAANGQHWVGYSNRERGLSPVRRHRYFQAPRRADRRQRCR